MIFLLLALQAAAPQDKPLEERVRKLEEAQAAPAGSKVRVQYSDGMKFSAEDGSFDASINGRMLMHGRAVFDSPGDENAPRRSVPDGFFIRQARLEASGTWKKDWGFKVQYDVASGTLNQSTGAAGTATTGTLRDAFVEWKKYREFTVRAGQYFEPLSQEDMCSTRFIDFVERSPLNRLAPGREIGLEVYGSLLEDRLSYFAMACNGGALLNDSGRGVVDTNDEKEAALLVYLSPFAPDRESPLSGLRLGVGASVGAVDTVPATAFDLVSTELSVLYCDSVSASSFDGRRQRLDLNLSYAFGPFGLRAEHLVREDEFADGAPEGELESSGTYVAATFILTGEDKKHETRITPKGDWGALELALRWARVEIDNAVDAGLFAAGSGNSDEVTAVTAGVNWWPVKNVRISLDVIREKYGDDLQFDNRMEDTLTGGLIRFQVDF